MILMVSGSTRSVAHFSRRWPLNLGHLLTPKNGNAVRTVLTTGLPWAIDNGAFSGFDAEAFTALAAKALGQPRLLWVVVPDVVGKSRETLSLFGEWQYRLVGLPLAFVGQDGQEPHDVPWDDITCLFIGGSTKWKLSHDAAALAIEAKHRGKLVHMGRVNSRRRIRHAQMFACDSIDGSSASMFGDTYIPKYLRWITQGMRQSLLTFGAAHLPDCGYLPESPPTAHKAMEE